MKNFDEEVKKILGALEYKFYTNKAESQTQRAEDEANEKSKFRAISSLKNLILECKPKKDGYAKVLAEKIGALSMVGDLKAMEKGFGEYKELKKIEQERNVGWNTYNAALTKALGLKE